MAKPDETTMKWLVDREALRQFPQRYARAVDERDHEALAALFDPDGDVDGAFGHLPVPEYLETMRNRPDTGGRSMHVLADPLIDLQPGDNRARMDTYAVVHQIPAPDSDGDHRQLGMRYLDDLVRRDGNWRIQHRVARMLWTS